MGISLNIATQLARISPKLGQCRNGLMLGRQKMHFKRPGWKEEITKRLNALGYDVKQDDLFQEDKFCEAYLNAIGWPKMESLDFTPMEGAEYVHDLGQPIPDDLKGRFDLIYDGGTTEHIFDIAQAFRNIDKMLTDDGVFISNVGADGWFGHGFYQIGPDIPWRYWVASLGYEMMECCVYNRSSGDFQEIPDPTGKPRGGEQSFKKPQFIFYAVRKRHRDGPEAPIVQSHYTSYPVV
ncbi:class I SAM-dependent methyltransferase [uncultured Aliiroseovarius sp.]|uniref:class I SAM-dependent methyltransferase n=1 Tax=uncultured Aliiroseovarius sp. TaxID=1658783 RepID=UPI00259997EF|nr:class I SAM-dependent methyltransferase [uncultured Aliiroseovarius sp.]